jgi:hypothetical protein
MKFILKAALLLCITSSIGAIKTSQIVHKKIKIGKFRISLPIVAAFIGTILGGMHIYNAIIVPCKIKTWQTAFKPMYISYYLMIMLSYISAVLIIATTFYPPSFTTDNLQKIKR